MSSCSSGRAFKRTHLIGNNTLSDGIFELEFDWTGPSPSSGQFFLIRPVRSSVLLGRAISVYGWEARGDRASMQNATGRLRFLIAERGTGTTELRSLHAGDEAELIGPLGNCWKDAAQKFHDSSGRPVALVGGGIGLAPLVHLATELPANSFDLYAGFRAQSYGLNNVKTRKLIIATEDGIEGHKGRIPEVIDWGSYSTIYACGPEPMLRTVAASCKAAGVPALLSLERRMACGVGACLGCTVRTIDGNRRCCADGPIFNAEEILFDD